MARRFARRLAELHAAMPPAQSRPIPCLAVAGGHRAGAGAALCLVAAASVLVAGCTVGPDFKRPEPPGTSAYTPEPLPAATAEAPVAGGGSQRFVVGQELQRQWWTMFRSDALDQDESYSVKFDRPGTYKYGCSIHPKMVGTISVTATATS